MTRFITTPSVIPSVWVKTRLEGSDQYSLTVMEKTTIPPRTRPAEKVPGCAYAKLTLLETGAVMASFPVMGMVSGAIRGMLGSAWFELAAPLYLPAFVFGQELEIPAGRHPIIFVLESWVVLFRPQKPMLRL